MTSTPRKDNNSSRTESDQKTDLICLVCGDSANGKNFSITSCESCKAFFRRNALSGVDGLQCQRSGACNITLRTRRNCKKCRLMKCISLGMDINKIETGEKKLRRNEKLSEKKRVQTAMKEQEQVDDPRDEVISPLPIRPSVIAQHSSSAPTASIAHPSFIAQDAIAQPLSIAQPSAFQQNFRAALQTQFGAIITPEMEGVFNEILKRVESKKAPCTCTCSCGRYLPGIPIVEQVEKE